MNPLPRLKPFTFTYVRYVEGDLVGKLLSLITLTPIFLAVSYATLVAFRRDIQTIYLGIGQLINLVLNLVLKSILNEERPPGADRDDMGMPSNHSQFTSFWATFCCLFLLVRVDYSLPLKVLITAAVASLTALVAFSRVYLGYHTPDQVCVGLAIGITMSTLWFLLYHYVVASWCPHIVQWSLCRLLYLKDHSTTPNVLAFEYESLAAKARAHRSSAGKKGKAS